MSFLIQFLFNCVVNFHLADIREIVDDMPPFEWIHFDRCIIDTIKKLIYLYIGLKIVQYIVLYFIDNRREITGRFLLYNWLITIFISIHQIT